MSQSVRALTGGGDEAVMREELAVVVAGLLGHLPTRLPDLVGDEKDRLGRLADLAVHCRSVVDRDGYNREIVNVPQSELPARFSKQIGALYRGLQMIGCSKDEAWRIVTRIALDSMPKGRRRVIEYLADQDKHVLTSRVADDLDLPTEHRQAPARGPPCPRRSRPPAPGQRRDLSPHMGDQQVVSRALASFPRNLTT